MTREEEILNQSVGLFGAADQQPKNTEIVFSKRQLDIAEKANKRYLGRPEHQYYSAEDLAKAFRDGAEWTEEHPQDVWHEASEMPKEEEWILIQYDEDSYDALVFCDMNAVAFCTCCKKCGSIRWAYISDLLPKQFGNSKQVKGGEQ